MAIKKDNTGLLAVITDGAANTSKVTVDGVPIIAKRVVLIIDPKTGYNEIKVHAIQNQRETVTEFYGISKDNYEYVAELTKLINDVPDEALALAVECGDVGPELYRALKYAQDKRKP